MLMRSKCKLYVSVQLTPANLAGTLPGLSVTAYIKLHAVGKLGCFSCPCRLSQAREAAQQLARGTVQQVEPVLARLADQQGMSQQVDDSLHSATGNEVLADEEEEVPQVSLITPDTLPFQSEF